MNDTCVGCIYELDDSSEECIGCIRLNDAPFNEDFDKSETISISDNYIGGW